ncbi:MAG: cytochrome c-type biogenesis protein CcmH [Chloroflexi bacterium]|nr:cytochrome c-type biogenesis protein CcmH [Chloroflexota bacterium]
MPKRVLSAWLVGLLLLGTAVTVRAQEGQTATPPVVRQVSDDEVNQIAQELYCPVCENTPLDVCGTQACADWRELIRTKLAEGETPQDVYAYFARQYGDSVLARPPREGINLILWLFPIAAVVLGLLFFGRYLQGLRSASAPANTMVETAVIPPSPSQDDYAARVERELQRK